jgi:hypothetical protein
MGIRKLIQNPHALLPEPPASLDVTARCRSKKSRWRAHRSERTALWLGCGGVEDLVGRATLILNIVEGAHDRRLPGQAKLVPASDDAVVGRPPDQGPHRIVLQVDMRNTGVDQRL